MLEVTDSDFAAKVLDSNIPVLVDFYADWCGPCKGLGTTLTNVESYFINRVKFVKLNVDENNKTAAKYGVRGLPTVMIIKSGVASAVKVGLMQQKPLMEWIESNI